MTTFLDFRDTVNEHLSVMTKGECLYQTKVVKQELWDTYLKSFPKGTNPLYKERTEHDCQCCKSFIQNCGNIVIIHSDLSIESIWDVQVEGHYQVVADAMSKFVKSKEIEGRYFHFQSLLGTRENFQTIMMPDSEKVRRWDHFYFKLPKKFVHSGEGNPLMKSIESKNLTQRSLDMINIEAINTVLELIDQNSIYRGEEFKKAVTDFKTLQESYSNISADHRDIFLWLELKKIEKIGGIKNTLIGTLLIDISVGMALDKAVAKYESKAAPENYKRPTALITSSMIKKAEEKMKSLGAESSIERRYAVAEDLTVNNVLFADRDAKKKMGSTVFGEMIRENASRPKNLEKVEEVSVDTFIENILPTAKKIFISMDNKQQTNLMSLIAPLNSDSVNIFKWGNNFSWSYNGEVADSIKEKVKRAGGDVEGDIRCSLAWFNSDDLDAHCDEPGPRGNHIYFGVRGERMPSSGMLDVDMNAGRYMNSIDPVENITYLDRKKMPAGIYEIYVHQYNQRSTTNPGFEFEIEFDGTIHSFHYSKIVKGKIDVADIIVDKNHNLTIKPHLESSTASKEIWGIKTHQFVPVSMIMNSPNHWDGEKTGNKHLFFIMEGCKNPDSTRGFYNEFLKEDFTEHRKVFEVLGSKMMVPESENQLSGLGFSLTKKASVICKVEGTFTRTIKINF